MDFAMFFLSAFPHGTSVVRVFRFEERLVLISDIDIDFCDPRAPQLKDEEKMGMGKLAKY